MWYIHAIECFSAIQRNETVPFAETWMDLESVIHSEVSQKEKNKFCIISLICGTHKNDTDELICKAEIETDIENKCMDTNRKKGWWYNLKDWD